MIVMGRWEMCSWGSGWSRLGVAVLRRDGERALMVWFQREEDQGRGTHHYLLGDPGCGLLDGMVVVGSGPLPFERWVGAHRVICGTLL